MGKTLLNYSVEKNGWVKRFLLLFALGLFTLFTGYQVFAQAALPTGHEGPWATMAKTGWSQSGLGPDYTTSELGGSTGGGSARFDNAGDQITINVGAAPGSLTYHLNPKNLGTFGGTFVVEESADGTTYTTLQTFGSGGTAITQNTTGGTPGSNTPNAASRFIRFRYASTNSTTHIMSLDKVSIQALSGPEINVQVGAANQLSGSTYNFGNQNLNTSSNAVTFTIQNTGLSDLSFTGVPVVSLSGADASLFTVNQSTTASTVAAGGTTTFTVSFAPTSVGAKTALLTIGNNDTDEGSYTINLSGTGKEMTPVISAINPTAGKVGDEVVITGTDLQNVTSVTFNGTAATFTTVSNTEIRATVPAGATTGPITVNAPGGSASSATFTVNPAPTITSFSPASGPVGTVVTINGTNFTADATITFNGTAVSSKTFVSATQMTATVPAGATTGPIAVTTNGGTATSAANFTVYPAPTITSFSPASGPVGTVVTINGTNFTADATITFNGTAVSSKTFVSATQMTATVPAGATTGPIAVTTNGGTATSATNYFLPPSITSFTPGSGYADDVITITGTDFTQNSVVYFNGVEAVSQVNSATEIQAMVPATATDGPISVTTEGGTATSAANFDVLYPAPTITSFSPAAGPVGTVVTISGTNFTSDAAIAFNGTPVISQTFVDATQIQATVPTGATTGDITVTTNGGTATLGTFTVYPAPTITSFSPASGPVGTEVTINGTDFTADATITFNGTAVITKTFVSATQMTATVPAGATSGAIAVTTNGGTGTSATNFTVNLAPTITAFTPGSGYADDIITITGTDFTQNSVVYFNGVEAVSQVNSATEIQAMVPATATDGPISVTTEGGTATSAANFDVLYPAPTITSFSPASGLVGTVVTINGTNFTADASITFNGSAVVSKTFVDATQMTATVPDGATTGPIAVTTNGGTATSATNFDVLLPPPPPPAPTITSFSPAFGPVGTEVTINGTDFTADATITFNGTAVITKTFVSATQMTATVPAGATSGAIAVTTNGGTGTSATNFTVYPAPTITAFTPGSGYADDIITITGTDFTQNSVVYFNGVEAVSQVNSATEIQAMVPATATDGPISVTTEGGTATSATNFDRLYPAPTITSFSPASGQVGTVVTINGTNFTADASITFNGTAVVTKTFVDATQMTAVVPAGTTDGLIDVTTNGGTATSATAFTISATGTYTWNGSSSANWSDANNWTPARNTPGASDELIFNSNATVTVNASETIGQLEFNNANVTFSVAGNQTLTIDGGVSGTDFHIGAGSSLTLDNSVGGEGLTIAITSGEAGLVEGALTLQGTATPAHQVTAAATNGLVFNTGSSFTTGVNFTGSPFGSATAGSVLFAGGSSYYNQGGGSPFGAAAPNGVVTFEPTSTYYHQQNTAPDLAGRTYGNFVIDFAGISQTASGSGNLIVTNLTMNNTGTFNLGLTGTVTINGDIQANAGTLGFDAGTYNMVGAAPSISGAGTFSLGTGASLNIASGSNLTLNNSNSITGTGQVNNEGTLTTAHAGGLVGAGGAFASATITNAAGSTVVYSGTGAQTITELAYASLTIEDRSQAITLPTGTNFKVSEVFTPAASATYSANSTIEFNGASQNVPVFPYHNLTISGSGVKTVTGTVNVAGQLYLNNSTLQTGANVVELGTTGTLNESGTGYLNGQVRVTRDVTSGTQTFGGVGAEMAATGGSPGTVTILRDTRTSVPARPGAGKGSITRVYYISSSNSTFQVTMSLKYHDNELIENGVVEGTGLSMYHQNAQGLWEEFVGTADLGANKVTLAGVTSFSPWTMAEPNTTLPVELTSFEAQLRNGLAVLTWTTATEDNNQGFEVQVSFDGLNFEKVGFVASKDPNSRVVTNYTFTDRQTLTSGIRYYRLKQVDLDGTVSYSRMESVTAEKVMMAARAYPNPFNDLFVVEYVAQTSHSVTLTIMDALGKKVSEQVVPVTPGKHLLQLQVGNQHPQGLYLLNISGEGNAQTLRVIKGVTRQ